MAPTRFILVRHAATDAVGQVLAGRAEGFPLNAQGRVEAVRLAESLRALTPASVFSSPRLRARETADAIGQAIVCDVMHDDRLDEVDFGAFQGQSFADLEHAHGWREWNMLRSLAATPGGETMLQVQTRAVSVLQDLHARSQGGVFVLVSHADIIKSVLCYALGSPIDLMQRVEIAPASTSGIAVWHDQVRVEHVNRTIWSGVA